MPSDVVDDIPSLKKHKFNTRCDRVVMEIDIQKPKDTELQAINARDALVDVLRELPEAEWDRRKGAQCINFHKNGVFALRLGIHVPM
jgi:hypothetical protein